MNRFIRMERPLRQTRQPEDNRPRTDYKEADEDADSGSAGLDSNSSGRFLRIVIGIHIFICARDIPPAVIRNPVFRDRYSRGVP
jgi:hypothetical protein